MRQPAIGTFPALAKRARSDRPQRAELMASLVERIAAEGITSADGVARTAGETLSTLRVDGTKVFTAARVLQNTACRWASLAPGDELDLDWPGKSRRRRR